MPVTKPSYLVSGHSIRKFSSCSRDGPSPSYGGSPLLSASVPDTLYKITSSLCYISVLIQCKHGDYAHMEYIITRRDVYDKAASLFCRSKTRPVFTVTGALEHARRCAPVASGTDCGESRGALTLMPCLFLV